MKNKAKAIALTKMGKTVTQYLSVLIYYNTIKKLYDQIRLNI